MCDLIELKSKSYLNNLNKVVKDEGFTECSFTFEIGSSKGDNYFGCIHRVIVTGIKHGKTAILNLILKTSANDNIRATIPIDIAYKRESFFYNEVLKGLESKQSENVNCKSKFYFVKCFHASDLYMEEMIILEDLKPQGFIMYDRLKSVDFDHAALVVSSLAKLHALSYIFKAKDPERFEELASKCPDIKVNGPFGKSMEPMFNAATDMLLPIIEDPKIVLKIEEFSKNIIKRMQNATKPGQYGVFYHGDCWTNNVLFKYQNGVPIDARLLDYQMMAYGSPSLDLLYFIFCCSDRLFRTKYYNTMLDIYYDTLTESLNGHSLDVNSVMSKESFLKEIKYYSDFSLGMAIVTLRSFVSEPEDAPDLSDAFDGKEVKVTLPTGEGYTRYVQRANEILGDFYDYGYLDK